MFVWHSFLKTIRPATEKAFHTSPRTFLVCRPLPQHMPRSRHADVLSSKENDDKQIKYHLSNLSITDQQQKNKQRKPDTENRCTQLKQSLLPDCHFSNQHHSAQYHRSSNHCHYFAKEKNTSEKTQPPNPPRLLSRSKCVLKSLFSAYRTFYLVSIKNKSPRRVISEGSNWPTGRAAG